MMVQNGDIVRVLAPGKFQGQTVKVLQVQERRSYKGRLGSINYRLDTKWDDTPYPAWFGRNEIEKVQKREEHSS